MVSIILLTDTSKESVKRHGVGRRKFYTSICQSSEKEPAKTEETDAWLQPELIPICIQVHCRW